MLHDEHEEHAEIVELNREFVFQSHRYPTLRMVVVRHPDLDMERSEDEAWTAYQRLTGQEWSEILGCSSSGLQRIPHDPQIIYHLDEIHEFAFYDERGGDWGETITVAVHKFIEMVQYALMFVNEESEFLWFFDSPAVLPGYPANPTAQSRAFFLDREMHFEKKHQPWYWWIDAVSMNCHFAVDKVGQFEVLRLQDDLFRESASFLRVMYEIYNMVDPVKSNTEYHMDSLPANHINWHERKAICELKPKHRKLIEWATKELKGKQRRVIELLCDSDGHNLLANLAATEGISWDVPYDGAFNSMCRALNPKLAKQGFRLHRHSNEAHIAPIGAQK